MRADRLLATLLILQARGRATVAELAAELEVSARTARRDLEALSTAGVPVYSQRGRGGGWSLVGGARTDLTGLSAREVRALFLAVSPAARTPELDAALRKLVQALPAPLRPGARAAYQAVVADAADRSTHLAALHRAVLEEVQVRLRYAGPGEPAHDRTVHPLGLATKAGRWYLVADTADGRRMFRVSRVQAVEPTGAPVHRPPGFDLAAEWRTLVSGPDRRMPAAVVRARAHRSAVPLLRGVLRDRLRIVRTLPDDYLEIEVEGPSAEVLAAQLAGFGARLEVLWPAQARARLAQLAGELSALYRHPPTDHDLVDSTPGSRADRP